MGARGSATSLGVQHSGKTRTPPRDGPGCWAREVSEVGLREGDGGDEDRKGVKVGRER